MKCVGGKNLPLFTKTDAKAMHPTPKAAVHKQLGQMGSETHTATPATSNNNKRCMASHVEPTGVTDVGVPPGNMGKRTPPEMGEGGDADPNGDGDEEVVSHQTSKERGVD